LRLLIPTFALEPDVFGLIVSFLDADGEGLAAGFTFEVGVAEGFGVAFGVAFGEAVGLGVGFGVGVTVGVGVGVTDGDGVGEGVGVGVTDGDGVGEGVGVGVTIVGAGALGPDGGDGTKNDACSGVTASEICEATDCPTEFTVVTVNVYGVPLVRPFTLIGDEVPVTVSPVSTTVTM
jgi:hypothetical protein